MHVWILSVLGFRWSIRSGEGPLATSAAMDELSAAAEGVPVPEMIFDRNFVELQFNRTAAVIRFDAIGGLRGCSLRAHKRKAPSPLPSPPPPPSLSSSSSSAAAEAPSDTGGGGGGGDEQQQLQQQPLPFYSVLDPPPAVEHALAGAWRERSARLTASGQNISFPVFNHDWTCVCCERVAPPVFLLCVALLHA